MAGSCGTVLSISRMSSAYLSMNVCASSQALQPHDVTNQNQENGNRFPQGRKDFDEFNDSLKFTPKYPKPVYGLCK